MEWLEWQHKTMEAEMTRLAPQVAAITLNLMKTTAKLTGMPP